ncbi:hypothetical protein [Noviherbaspirillum massiliense]|uniref:hypothetical protein n=1 Tax=Noviherbaspirillum massiliense TaxID=1465823 RepID=UPI0011DD376C|nr:hypothetical protein [Noviherbaspirillum massiliense]
MHEWTTLTTRYGVTTQIVDSTTLRNALTELFTSPRDDEHPDCWIECGSQDGPLYTLNIFQSWYGIYTKYSDVDMTEELETKELKAPTVEAALRLWEALIHERYEEL